MYCHTFFVTSVRAIFFPPHTAASAGDKFFGAKRPLPAFFWARAFAFEAAEIFFFDWVFLSEVILCNSA